MRRKNALKGSPFKPGQLTVQNDKWKIKRLFLQNAARGNNREIVGRQLFLKKKTKTTTSLAVTKRTARQGEHWNNG